MVEMGVAEDDPGNAVGLDAQFLSIRTGEIQ